MSVRRTARQIAAAKRNLDKARKFLEYMNKAKSNVAGKQVQQDSAQKR